MLDIDQFADSGQLFDDHYKLIRPLNTDGGTADVWLAIDKVTVKNQEDLDEAPFLDDASLAKLGLLVAIKIYRPKNALDIEGVQRFREEYMIVFNCNHSNLIHPVHFSIFEETPYLVLPYCERGSSELMIGNFVNDDDIWKYIKDVTAGLNYLHESTPPIIHQDIKPANVLIDDNGNYAITDFGITKHSIRNYGANEEDEEDFENSGTYAYMAPERFIQDNPPTTQSDIWAFGATLYELISGNVPFGENGGSEQPDGEVSLPFAGLNISEDIKQLICDSLAKDPEARPTAKQLLMAAYRKKYIVKKKKLPGTKALIAAACAIVTIGLVSLFFINRNTANPSKASAGNDTVYIQQADGKRQQVTKSMDELFDDALILANATASDSVKQGIAQLEVLASKNHIPALYELAITYGGLASDEEMAYNRKKLLGITLGNKNVPADEQDYLPQSDLFNDKAISFYKAIVDVADAKFNEMNMKSAYRLGYYFLYLKKDKATAKGYFTQAKNLANQVGNSRYASNADIAIGLCSN